jgi:hypothetical protein
MKSYWTFINLSHSTWEESDFPFIDSWWNQNNSKNWIKLNFELNKKYDKDNTNKKTLNEIFVEMIRVFKEIDLKIDEEIDLKIDEKINL